MRTGTYPVITVTNTYRGGGLGFFVLTIILALRRSAGRSAGFNCRAYQLVSDDALIIGLSSRAVLSAAGIFNKAYERMLVSLFQGYRHRPRTVSIRLISAGCHMTGLVY